MSSHSDLETTSTEQAEYRRVTILRNKCWFLNYYDFMKSTKLIARRQEVRSLLDVTESDLNSAVDGNCLSELEPKLSTLVPKLRTKPGGYDNAGIITQAVRLLERLLPLTYKVEEEWTYALRQEVWDFFSLCETFSYSLGSILWFRTDTAIAQLISARASLKQAKPDFACGLLYSEDSPMLSRVLQWHAVVVPDVDLQVAPDLYIPFFIFESKSVSGSIIAAENHLANSMLRAHDILCSLRLNQSLYILGAIQHQFSLSLYVSFSLRTVDEDGKEYCESLHLVNYKTCLLNDVNGCLQFLQFMQHVKNYGSTTFKDSVEAAIMSKLP